MASYSEEVEEENIEAFSVTTYIRTLMRMQTKADRIIRALFSTFGSRHNCHGNASSHFRN